MASLTCSPTWAHRSFSAKKARRTASGLPCSTIAPSNKSVTKRRNGEEYISRQSPEQETTKGTHNKRQPANAGQQRYTSHERHSPNQAAVQASNEHTTVTSHRPLCHRGTRHRHWGTAPTAGATGTRAVHIQLKPRRRGNPPARVRKPRHGSAGALSRNKQDRRKLTVIEVDYHL